jgi:hypothetical protein
MDLIIIEGMYENGKVELAENPQGVELAQVRVIFLTQAQTEQTKPVRTRGAAKVRSATAPLAANRYPQTLREEYETLIHKKLRRAMTPEEAVRLEAVRVEINRLDRQSGSWSAWERRAAGVEREVAALRQELEALPDA